MSMKIPVSFQLFGQTIFVTYDDRDMTKDGQLGIAYLDTGHIKLQPVNGTSKLKKGTVEQVFCHELVHHILHAMNETKLATSEKFTDNFASLLHQALSTARYTK
jgi:predicted SprT family Zn-dependent metalloprotease